jgi:hypothetical protein
LRRQLALQLTCKPTRPDIFVGGMIPILSISIVPTITAAIITLLLIGDTRTIACPFARITS